MLRYIITTRLAKIRWSIGWSLYHELDLPMDKVGSIIKSTDADPWHYGSIQDRRRRGEVISTMDWIVKHVPKDELIFEVGCGCGANLIWLAQHGYRHLTGTDRSSSAISAATQLAELARQSITFRVADGFIPSGNNISVLMALNSIYYAPIDMSKYLTSCRDRLASNGHVIFDMIDRAFDQMPKNRYLTDDWRLPENQRRPTQYVVRISPKELSEQATKAGFKTMINNLSGAKRPPRYLAVLRMD
ncbi:class I SAM-dependent methyltransferase [Bradyrhizobium sp. BWA-3-5]|uniref:class I SAM-dependent methyltransferase n=1 Tax=Bradyrhizobium sp. BWA-3-5 TaxID=3080013 RepID=UPI00293F3EAA|nr:class I SAM-dependent methyltransferase [Bradyrhizobium sp. BWA-3-5]WOH67881.1 class I SAM-dependent methyltransferase [Bradyrhizobium sp. BWA-3-5]